MDKSLFVFVELVDTCVGLVCLGHYPEPKEEIFILSVWLQ